MGMLKPIAAATGAGALLAPEEAEAGVVLNALGKPVVEGWHGGLKGVDRFKDEFLGSGEGAHVYTHGHYMADQKKTANKYYNDRKREYEREVASDAWNKDLLLEYVGGGGSGRPLEFKVADAPSIFMSISQYEDIITDALVKYGKDVDKAQDYISRKILRYDQRVYDDALSLITDGKNGDYDIDDSFWRIEAEDVLARMLGMTEGEMRRSLTYDLRDKLPPGVGLPSLSADVRNSMLNDLVLERLEFNTKRYSWDMKARREATVGEMLTPAQVADGGAEQKLKEFEFQLHPDMKEKFAGQSIIDWDKVSAGGGRKPGMYRLHADVTTDELLHWERPLSEHPESVKMGISSAMQDLLENDIANGFYHPDDLTRIVPVHDEDGYAMSALDLIERVAEGRFPPGFTAADFATQFSNSVSYNGIMNGEELSKLLRSKGIKGMMYQDGWTRGKDGAEPFYNYVVYGDDLISIQERGMSTVPMQILLATGVGAGLGAPVLNKEVAERFPMPQEEKGMLERIAGNPNVKAAMAHPLTQYAGQQLENAEWPSRLLSSVVEGIANLYEGESLENTGKQFANRMQTPYEETSQEVGQYVLKETGSPAAATAAYMGMFAADPTNYIGP